MKRARRIRVYAVEQARELLAELGIDPPKPESRAVLESLHFAAQSVSLTTDFKQLLRAEAMIVAGRLEKALSLLRELTDKGIHEQIRGLAFDRMGDIAWWNEDFNRAADAYRNSLALRPEDGRTRKDLARALWHLGDSSNVDSAFGMDVARSIESTPAGQVLPLTQSDGVAEVFGLYVSPDGAGVMPLQGCLDTQPGMVATGSLGSMAQEACDLAWTLWRRASTTEGSGVRVHSPQAGIQKDGPSLGLAVYVLFGVVLGELDPQPGDCFTGELDLKGRVLPIGGADMKALAAYLSGFRRLFLPTGNMAEVEESFKDVLEIRPIGHVGEVGKGLAQ